MNEKMRERALWVLEHVYRGDPDVAQRLVDLRVTVRHPEQMPVEVEMEAMDSDHYPERVQAMGLICILNAVLGPGFEVEAVYVRDKLVGFKPKVTRTRRST